MKNTKSDLTNTQLHEIDLILHKMNKTNVGKRYLFQKPTCILHLTRSKGVTPIWMRQQLRIPPMVQDA